MKRLSILINFILFSISIYCQYPSHSFSVLNYNNTARSAALGGYSIAVLDNDPTTSILLPSNIQKENSGHLVMNYVNYFADSDYGLLNYTYHFKNLGVFSASFIYCDYGTFEYADPSGFKSGNNFYVYDIMSQIGYSKKLLENLQVGFNLKFASSQYEQYNSLALASDISATYFDDKKQFGSSFLIQNIGRSLKSFQPTTTKESLPFNIQFAINKKLAHSPIRFHLILHDLQKWNINSDKSSNNSFSYHLTNHIVLASEFLLSENFNFRLGYNFKNRRDLQPLSRAGSTGFSWGVGFKVKKIRINYSLSKFHFSGTSNNFTLIRKITS